MRDMDKDLQIVILSAIVTRLIARSLPDGVQHSQCAVDLRSMLREFNPQQYEAELIPEQQRGVLSIRLRPKVGPFGIPVTMLDRIWRKP